MTGPMTGRAPRYVLRAAFGAAVTWSVLGLAGGCTFLVSFDDIPQAQTKPDAAVDVVDAPSPPDAEVPVEAATESGTTVPVTPACDSTFPLDQIEGCATFVEGAQICADNPGLTKYPGDRTTDVVACSKTQGATCVRHCIACAHLPAGFPDQCDQCIGKPDGTYCGTDMGWQPEHFRLLVTCAGERLKETTACSTKGCDSVGGAGAAVCRPEP